MNKSLVSPNPFEKLSSAPPASRSARRPCWSQLWLKGLSYSSAVEISYVIVTRPAFIPVRMFFNSLCFLQTCFWILYVKSRVLISVWRRALVSSLVCGQKNNIAKLGLRLSMSDYIHLFVFRNEIREYGANRALSCEIEDWSRCVDVYSMSRGIDSGAAAPLGSPEASLGSSSYNWRNPISSWTIGHVMIHLAVFPRLVRPSNCLQASFLSSDSFYCYCNLW